MTTGRDIVRLALTQAGKPYIWGSETVPTDPSPRSFDCSELVQWTCQRLGIEMVDGSWLQYAFEKGKGQVISVEEAKRTPGALLFHFSSNPLTGRRPVSSHVGISLGDGRTIEARGKSYGTLVCWASNRFNYATKIAGVNHGGAITTDHPNVVPAPKFERFGFITASFAAISAAKKKILHHGDRNYAVKIAQLKLDAAGFACTPNGYFGDSTLYRVKRFQKVCGLRVDGVIGPKTWAKLFP